MKSVTRDLAVRGREHRPQDVAALQIAAFGAVLAQRPDRPEAAALGVQDAAEHRVGIEAPERAPVDAAVAADQRRAVAVADRGIVADRPVAGLGHALAHAAAAGHGRRLVHRQLLARGPAPENRPAARGRAGRRNQTKDTRPYPPLPTDGVAGRDPERPFIRDALRPTTSRPFAHLGALYIDRLLGKLGQQQVGLLFLVERLLEQCLHPFEIDEFRPAARRRSGRSRSARQPEPPR